MISKSRASWWRSIALQGTLLVLPVMVVIAVAMLAYHAVLHVDRLTTEGNANPQSYLASSQLQACLAALNQKANASGQVLIDDVKACETRAANAQSIDDLIKNRLDELKWILTMIGSIGAFFVIAQGGAAFFSALAYSRQAEKTLDDIGKIQEEIVARYPVFGLIEDQRALALIDLAQDVKTSSRADNPNADPTEVLDYEYKNTLYGSMDLRKRQRILSVESFASVDLHPGPMGVEDYPDNLRRLAIFYQSKFQYERNVGFGSLADLERAEGYLRLAIEKSRGDFTLLNDLGVVCLDMVKAMKSNKDAPAVGPDYRKSADEAFQASIRSEPFQMRAHYNLAVLSAKYGMPNLDETEETARKRHYTDAIAELDKALAPHQSHWQRANAPSIVKALARYNRGCYRARLLGADTTKPTLTAEDAKDFLDDLGTAANLGGIPVKIIERDFNPPIGEEGDIVDAYKKSDQELISLLDQVKQALLVSSKLPARQPLSPWKALRESLKIYKASRRKS